MKAVVFHEHGGVEKLRYEDFQDPVIEANEVLVKVRACALNYIDLWVRRGLSTLEIPLPHISGSDISGIVADVGRLATGIDHGSNVIVSPGLSCGRCESCLSGRDNFCAEYKIVGVRTSGGYAEYVKVPAENILPMPKGLSFEEASAFPLVFLTAWHMLFTRAHLKQGEWVMVLGAGGGVGTAALQIAKLLGGKVIAAAGREDKLNKAWEMGADRLINYTTNDITKEVKKITGDKGVDVVIEHVGSATWKNSIQSLAPGGRLVTCGATSGNLGETDIRRVFAKQLDLLGSYMGSKGELIQILSFFVEGKLKPVVGRLLPLEKAGIAQELMEERMHFGKIVLKVA